MTLLSVADALAAITTHVPRLPVQPLPLRQLAGCGLAETIAMERDQPPFDRVAMDGIAMMSAATASSLRIAGTQAAGAAPLSVDDANSCVEVMTGAELPRGADCVIPVEAIEVVDSHARLRDGAQPTPWKHIHRRGSDARSGDAVLTSGKRLTAIDIAVIASAGVAQVKVRVPPRIALVSTGNELVEPGQPIEPWQIRRSNIHAVRAALTTHGFTSLHDEHLEDDLGILRTRLKAMLDNHDVLVLSGGVSMGKFDHVPQALTDIGVQCVFHKIAQKPGKPMWFGIRPDGKAVFALPGNPVSTLICLHRYVLPGLTAMMGCAMDGPIMGGIGATPLRVPVQGTLRPSPDLTVFMPVKLGSDAGLIATPAPTRGSGDFMSLLGTDGFVEVAPDSATTPPVMLPFFSW